MLLQSWSDVLANSLLEVWLEFARVIPNLFGAVLIFIIGWLVGAVLGGIVAQLVRSLRLDAALSSLGVDELVEKAGMKLDSGAFIGGVVKWFFIISFLMASVNILGLTEVSAFLRQVVLGYLPNVIVAALVLLVAAIVAEATQKFVVVSARAADFPSAGLLGGISRWAIWIFAILVALSQLGIAADFAQTLFSGVVAMLAIAGGIAFGLGGKDAAEDFIDKLKGDISSKK